MISGYVDPELQEKIDFVASCLPKTRYPLVLRVNGVDYVVGKPIRGVTLLTGFNLIGSNCHCDYGYPVICKLTDIWAD